jgi:hypothetical protein
MDSGGVERQKLMTRTPDTDHANPPRWAEALLRRQLAARDSDTIAGDLLEHYREVIPSAGDSPRREHRDLAGVIRVMRGQADDHHAKRDAGAFGGVALIAHHLLPPLIGCSRNGCD